METIVVNINNKEEYDIYIGLGTKWGNPYAKGVNMTNKERDLACDNYEKYFWEKNLFLYLDELKGKRLGCHCKPKRCHGDFLARLVNTKQIEL